MSYIKTKGANREIGVPRKGKDASKMPALQELRGLRSVRVNKVIRKQKGELRRLAAVRDTEIDFSDQPEVRDWSRAVVGKFYGPIKSL